MIKHIVMWKIKDECDGMNKKEMMNTISEKLASLKGKIKEIIDIEGGPGLTNGDMNYDMGLIVTLNSLEDLPLYINHPEHLKVREFISKVRLARTTVDIEV